jgi:hypothetical protein
MEVQWTKLTTPPLYPNTTASNNTDWDFTRYTPDIVVINLGANDALVPISAATYQTAYVGFLKLIRSKFPKAQIFSMRPYGGHMETQVVAAEASAASGDSKMHYMNTTGWLASSDYDSDGLHPTDAGQIKAAAKVAAVLKPYLDSLQTTTGIEPRTTNPEASTPIRLTKHLTLSISPDGRNMTRGGSFVKGQILVTTPE